jgi:phenylacetate-CoA ligase
MAGEFYDDLERRDPEQRERDLEAQLPKMVAIAKERSPGFGKILADIDPAGVVDRRALADLPITRKSDLAELQKSMPPFGGLTTVRNGELARIFASPGPIYDPEARRADYWRTARCLFAAGFRRGDVVHNCYSYHLTPAGSMVETGSQALGCAVIPGGTGQSELQVRTIADVRPDGYAGTPSFLKILLDKAEELGADISSLRKASVGAEAFPAAMRDAVKARGVDAYQSYGTADLGMIAYETPAREGLVLNEDLIVEIVYPGSRAVCPPGIVGEVVVTSLSPEYPLIRFATGDLSVMLPGHSPCGRTNFRIKGWMGRADQRTKVKGMFVDPSQVNEVMRRHKEIIRARLVVSRDAKGLDAMALRVEMGEPTESRERIAESLQSVTKLRGSVEVVPQGGLPNDGKVIDDTRPID